MENSSNSVESQENILIKICNDKDDNVIIKFNRESAGGNIQSNPTRNLYSRFFGPTLDETIPVGCEIIRNIYCCDCDTINPDEGSHRSKHSEKKMQSKNKLASSFAMKSSCNFEKPSTSSMKPQNGSYYSKDSKLVSGGNKSTISASKMSQYSSGKGLKKKKKPPTNLCVVGCNCNLEKSTERTQTDERISMNTSELETSLPKIRKTSNARTQTAKKTQSKGKKQSEETTQTKEKAQPKEKSEMQESNRSKYSVDRKKDACLCCPKARNKIKSKATTYPKIAESTTSSCAVDCKCSFTKPYYSSKIKKLSTENTQTEDIISLNTSEVEESNRWKYSMDSKKDACICCPKDRKEIKRKTATSPKIADSTTSSCVADCKCSFTKPYYSSKIKKLSPENTQTEDIISLNTSEVEVYHTNYETQAAPNKHYERVTRQFYISPTQVQAKDRRLDRHHDSPARYEPCKIWPTCKNDVCNCPGMRHRSGGGKNKLKAPCEELMLPGIGGYTMFERMLSKRRQRRIRNHEFYKTSLEMWTTGKCSMFCTNCRKNVKPLVKTKKNKVAYNSFAAALLISCWPLCFLCQDNCVMELYCPYCRLNLNVYNTKSNCCRR